MKVNTLSAQKARRSTTLCHFQLAALVPEVHIDMSSIDGFQIFQSRNQNGEQRHVSGTPIRGNARPGDERYTPNGNRQDINESSCGSGSAHLELTQQESEEFTQNSNTNSAVKKKPAEPEPIPHAWGMLRRQGGLQEEFELHHRVVDLKRDTYTIGRSSKSDITVADTWVSTTHCMVYCDYSQPKLRIFIEDCSANGTYINDSLTRLRKNERMELKSGDQIYLLNPRKEENLKKTHASFVFINLRERLVTRREISFAPEHLNQLGGTDQYAITTQQNTTHNTSRLFSTHLSHQYAPHIEDKYIIGDQIGSGMSGQVYFCVNKLTHEQFAVKMIETKKFSLNPGLSVADLREEASLMREFDHPNIIKVVDSFQSDTMIYIVMEWLRGGDLFDRIMERERYTEDTARHLMKQVFSAVEYLHNKNIIHRDLKPENILLVSNKSDVDVKVTDFGLAKKANREGLKTFCGTPQYFAPEVLQRKHHDKSSLQQLSRYGKAVDMWSLGVVLYILLSGSFPFGDDEEILRANYSLSGVEWDGISPGAKHLIRSLMMLNVQDRFTVQEALQHPWINGCNDAPSYQSAFKGSAAGVPAGNKKRPPLMPTNTTNNTQGSAVCAAADSNNTTTTTTANTAITASTATATKRAPTTATLKRATSNLHRVNSVFAPLELKHKTSLVYAAAVHSSSSTNTATTSITNGSSKGLASGVTAGSSRNSGYPPLPPASEVFTVFGKVTSPTPAASANTNVDATIAIAEMKPPKQRNRKGKASTTDDMPIGTSNAAGVTLSAASPAVGSRTSHVAKSSVEGCGTTARMVPITESPTDYIDLSHTQYTSTIQLATRNNSIVHLTVCNTSSCMDAFLPAVGYLPASREEHASIGTTTANAQSVTKSHIPIAPNATVNKTSPPEFKRSTSFADSTIITSPSIRLNTATSNTTFACTPTTTIDTPTNYVLNSKSPGFTITPKTDLNIDPYDDVIEDYSSDEAPNDSNKSSEKQSLKRQKRGNNTPSGTVVLTKPPLSGGKSRAKKTANKEAINVLDPAITNMEGCATPVNNNNVSEVKTDSGEKRRKRSVSFSDLPKLLHNDTTVANDLCIDKVVDTTAHSIEPVEEPTKEITADVKVAVTSSAVIDNPLPGSRGIKRMQSSLEQAWKIKPATIAAATSTASSVVTKNVTDVASGSSTSSVERTSPNENMLRRSEATETMKDKAVDNTCTSTAESESMPPPAKKLRMPMKSLTELFRMSTSSTKQ